MKHGILMFFIVFGIGTLIAYLKFDYTYWIPGVLILVAMFGYQAKKFLRGVDVE
jgi:hypothetical protein